MSGLTMRSPLTLSKRQIAVLGALLAAIAMYVAATAAPASAVPYCYGTLQPYGHSGDRCYGTIVPDMNANLIVTFERAGCVDVANGSNELLQSWICGSAGSAPEFAAEMWPPHDGVWRKPVIRNNNLSFTGYFQGRDLCYNGGC